MNDVQAFLNEVWRDLQYQAQQTQLEMIAEDPKAHKLTMIMSHGKRWSYRYFPAGKDGRGWRVRYCYSCWRNAAGYFLSWREVIPPKGSSAKHAGKRDMFAARKVRKRARALAERRAAAFKEKRAAA